MIRAFRSEWIKLLRPGPLWTLALAMIGFGALLTGFIFNDAPEQLPTTPPPPSQRNQPFVSVDMLEQAAGPVMGYQLSATLYGIVALILFAQAVGSEYGYGTLKVLLARQPRRGTLLAGKLTAVAVFIILGQLVAFLAQLAVAYLVARSRGFDLSAWSTQEAAVLAVKALARGNAAGVAWGLLGATLALLLRSSPAAIGIGLGYSIVGEQLVVLMWSDGQKYLPGLVMAAFAQGGTPVVDFTRASVTLALYVIAFIVASFTLFRTRDVST